MVDQNLLRDVENVYYRYFRRRRDAFAQVQRNAEQESNLRWHALYALLDGTPPDAYHAIDFEDGLAILVLIGDAAHILRVTDQEAETLSVGPLYGGVYTEKIVGGQDGEIVGTFEHTRLRSPLTIHAGWIGEDDAAKAVRTLFRQWASRPAPHG